VNGFVNLVCHPISSTFSVVNFTVIFLAQFKIAVVGYQIGERMRGRNDVVGMLVEHDEKIIVSR
jgi:hypothetical protein